MKTATIKSVVNTMEEALSELGVSGKTLTTQEKKALDERGYVILSNLINSKLLKQLQVAFEEACKQERAAEGYETSQEQGTRHINSLGSQFAVLEPLYTHPKLLAAVYQILKRDFKLSGLHGRDPLPGYGQQGLHTDWTSPAVGEFQVVTALWLLDDFTPESGPTRLVPGTHLARNKPDKKLLAPTAKHPQQILAIAPAGSLLIFNGHTWHSGTQNDSKNHRRVITCLFHARENRQFTNPEWANLGQLSPVIRYLLAV